MAAVRYSSTLPNAFDTRAIAEAKLLQVAQGDAFSITLSGTVEYSPPGDDAFDTQCITLEKLLQSGSIGGVEVLPPIVSGQQYLQDEDGGWHLMDLVKESGVNVIRVGQSTVTSPGPQYQGYIVLDAGATNHRLSIHNEGGVFQPFLDQSTTAEDGAAVIVLNSSDAVGYDVSAVLEGGIYQLQIEQP